MFRAHIDSILEGCKKNDRLAQEQLYKYYYDSMMNMCLRYTSCEADAKHVLNAGFFRVFKSIHQYNAGKGSLYTWIHTIILRCCLDFVKEKQPLTYFNELKEVTEVYIDADADQKINADEILQKIRLLPPASQMVFNLFVAEGFSHKEIAEKLNISEGTSKWHLNEARKLLKQFLVKNETSNQ
ncbi:MAG: RNA polymerase sigma factor [Bacteroidetes bacterium]|nr:RNA polymerase sigma factor [Bacteroidota bacterium]